MDWDRVRKEDARRRKSTPELRVVGGRGAKGDGYVHGPAPEKAHEVPPLTEVWNPR